MTTAPLIPLAEPDLPALEETGLRRLRHVLWQEKLTLVGLAIIAAYLLLALIGPALVAYDPIALDMDAMLAAPSAAHPFGTDNVGRDILARTVAAPGLGIGLWARP